MLQKLAIFLTVVHIKSKVFIKMRQVAYKKHLILNTGI